MSASQQCHACRYTCARYPVVLALALAIQSVHAADDTPAVPGTGCDSAAVVAHVREQLEIYGPRSQEHEYFGFIYRMGGDIASAVIRGNRCRASDRCSVDPGLAASRIPPRAKVLGEWHTHSHLTGSRMLSIQDVRGARANLHIRCYTAYYAGPDGEMFTWDLRSDSVVAAMKSRVSLGRYGHREEQAPAPLLAVTPGRDQTQ